jgi:hypothetical protein
MPKGDYYYGLPLREAILKLAEHHFEPKNRHISEDEYRLLIRAANALEADRDLRDALLSVHRAAMDILQGPAAKLVGHHLDQLSSTGSRPTAPPPMATAAR